MLIHLRRKMTDSVDSENFPSEGISKKLLEKEFFDFSSSEDEGEEEFSKKYAILYSPTQVDLAEQGWGKRKTRKKKKTYPRIENLFLNPEEEERRSEVCGTIRKVPSLFLQEIQVSKETKSHPSGVFPVVFMKKYPRARSKIQVCSLKFHPSKKSWLLSWEPRFPSFIYLGISHEVKHMEKKYALWMVISDEHYLYAWNKIPKNQQTLLYPRCTVAQAEIEYPSQPRLPFSCSPTSAKFFLVQKCRCCKRKFHYYHPIVDFHGRMIELTLQMIWV